MGGFGGFGDMDGKASPLADEGSSSSSSSSSSSE
jgi:hypothetical protein